MKKFILFIAFLMAMPSLVLAQGLPLKDGVASTLATIATCGTPNCLAINPPVVKENAGFVAVSGRVDDGTITGSAKNNRIFVTENGREMVAQTLIMWDDTFNSTTQNTSKYRFAATTQTGAQTGGFLILNNSGITTANTNSAIQTQRTFPVFGNSEVRAYLSGGFAAATAPVANNTVEFGLFTATIPGGAAPTDGVFFRYNAAAELRGVINYNGTETQTAALTQPSLNVNHDFLIVVQNNVVGFWIDGVLYGSITLTVSAPAQGQPFSQATLPYTIRQYIGAGAPVSATKIQVSDIFVTLVGPDTTKLWSEAKAGMGHMAYQGQNGGTVGTTAQYANNANPAAAVPTNTTAALGSGLGGIFQETVSLAAATDGIISSFQNPTGSVTQTPRNLIIRGVCTSGTVTVVLAATALTGTMALNYGHTAVSLATAESGSFVSPTTKAPRRIALGTTALLSAAAVGTNVGGQPFCRSFDSPVVVAPGEFVAVSHKKVSAAPATGVIMWAISFDAYFE